MERKKIKRTEARIKHVRIWEEHEVWLNRLKRKLGLDHSSIMRMGLAKLADAEGVTDPKWDDAEAESKPRK